MGLALQANSLVVVNQPPPQFEPGRTVFLAQSWPAGFDPLVFFTTLQAALAQAAALTPTSTDPVLIAVFSGTYAGAATLVSNVYLWTGGNVIFTGLCTWQPGQGVNAPQGTTVETIQVQGCRLTGGLTIDASLKPSNGSVFTLLNGTATALNYLGRVTQQDNFTFANNSILNGAQTITNAVFTGIGSRWNGAATVNGNTFCDLDIASTVGVKTFAATATGRFACKNIGANISVGATNSLDMRGSCLGSAVVVTVAAGGAVDLRAGEYNANANLAGAGTIDRSIWRTSFGPTAIGANAVPIAPPLPNGSYNVAPCQTAGVSATMPAITAKTGAGFTLTDVLGGHTYDLTILRE